MILCPICRAKTRVLETRDMRRRRGCTTAGCEGKVTTVEVVVPEGRVSELGSGSLIVSARKVAKLRDLVAQITGGTL
jgi:hypothetical protein